MVMTIMGLVDLHYFDHPLSPFLSREVTVLLSLNDDDGDHHLTSCKSSLNKVAEVILVNPLYSSFSRFATGLQLETPVSFCFPNERLSLLVVTFILSRAS